MQKLTAFVTEFKKFMKSIEESPRIDNKYVEDFEKIFSVTEESLLLREIQDIKDELNMLTAVFKDQLSVLHKAGKDIADDRARLPETRSSAFNFQQQSEKHARHIERMRVQASQAYDTVSHLST
jgi:predicted  nucleic acid-binding Zn-ribbon protein